MYKQHIYPIRLGLTIAIVMFISMFLLALITKFNYGGLMFKIISDAYPGCNNKNLKGVLMVNMFYLPLQEKLFLCS